MKHPLFVAIAGGSGSGKSWLARKLIAALSPNAASLSLDDFYVDRSHLSAARRARLNFDHPRSIDWNAVQDVLRLLSAGRAASIPCYDFGSHCRLRKTRRLRPSPIIIIEGLWPLQRAAMRRLFAFRIFLNASAATRLRRRLNRDCVTRGRTDASVKEQFWKFVEPMQRLYVEPQARFADLIISDKQSSQIVTKLAALLREKSGQIRK